MSATAFLELKEERKRHNTLLKQWNVKALELAEKQAKYDKLRAVATLEERSKGTSISIIKVVVDGREDIADLKMEVNICKAMIDTIDKAIDDSKWNQKMLLEEMSREWNRIGN